MESKSILIEAENIVNGERAKDYGDAVKQFDKVADIATIMLNEEERSHMKRGCLSATICVKVLMAVKICRESNSHKVDNLVDLCGYAEILNRIEER